MQLDYHYYAIFQLAKLAGFDGDDASTIAFASQYVDDSTESEPIEPFPDQHFDTIRTAHYNLEAFGWNVQKKIYMPFHFVPPRVRWTARENFTYVTKPASLNENELTTMLVKDALTEENHRFRLVRLGVALHTVADTFSHFGFSGRHHDENNVGRIWNKKKNGGWELETVKSFVGDIFVPRIGHIEAFEFPDQPFLEWRYTNNESRQRTRGNLKQSINGVKLIYHFLKLAKDPLAQSIDLAREHAVDFRKIRLLLKAKAGLSRRCDQWKNYTQAPEYNKTDWRKEALEGDVEWDDMSLDMRRYHTKKLKGRTGFDTSKWAYFHRAAFKQRSLVIGWLN